MRQRAHPLEKRAGSRCSHSCAAFTFVFAFVWLLFLQWFTSLMVWLTVLLGIAAALGITAYCWACYAAVRRRFVALISVVKM